MDWPKTQLTLQKKFTHVDKCCELAQWDNNEERKKGSYYSEECSN